jgi:hypothetical protein
MFVKQIVLVQFLLLFSLLSIMPVTSIAEFPQPVYKAGDYFTYKVKWSYISQNQACTIEFTFRIDIVEIEMPIVYFNKTYEDVKTTGKCSKMLFENETYSDFIYKKPSEAEFPMIMGRIPHYLPPESPKEVLYTLEFPFPVDPSYSGEYRNSTQDPHTGAKAEVSLKYKKGVLLSGSGNYDYGVLGKESFVIELIDSSVAEFKPSPPIPLYLWIIIGVVAIGAVVGVVFYISRRRRSRSHLTPPQPQFPPAPPPAPSI